MEKIINALSEIKEINLKYELDIQPIDKLRNEIPEAKVCTPIIGKFSSGKSALVNTLLGNKRRLLKEDITPETAVPAEIVLAFTDKVCVYNVDGTTNDIAFQDYGKFEADANTVKCVRIQLKNDFLATVPDVMLVDMPGFESGFAIHNKAIDDYLPKSLAYIITFPADDMIVRSTIGGILKELHMNNMPICIVITKFDKHNDEFEKSLAHLKDNLKKYVGNEELHFCTTSSLTGDAEEVKEFLRGIQLESQTILANSFKAPVLIILDTTEKYLKTTLANSQLSESDLQDQIEKLNQQKDDILKTFAAEREKLFKKTNDLVEQAKCDVMNTLQGNLNSMVTMTMNKQDISGYVNNLVRQNVTNICQTKLEEYLAVYLKKIKELEMVIPQEKLPGSEPQTQLPPVVFNEVIANLIQNITIQIVSNVAKYLGIGAGSATGILSTSALGGPLAMLAGLAAASIVYFVMKSNEREEAKHRIEAKLQGEVFPQIMNAVGTGMQQSVETKINEINANLEQELNNQQAAIEKALQDLKLKVNEEKETKEALAASIKTDLARIEEIKNAL